MGTWYRVQGTGPGTCAGTGYICTVHIQGIGTGYRVQVLGASREHRYRVQVHGTNTGKGVG